MFETFLERRKFLIFALLIYLMPTPVIWSYMVFTSSATPFFGVVDYSDESSFGSFLGFFASSFLWLPVFWIVFEQPFILLYFALSYGLLAYFYEKERQKGAVSTKISVPVN